jgi:hypothetical protein
MPIYEKEVKMIKGMVYLKEKNSYYSLISLNFQNDTAIISTTHGEKAISFDEIRQIFLTTEKTITISRE